MSAYLDYWYESNDGLKLYARQYPHQSPLATVICIPGLTRHSADFTELCEKLNKDYCLYAVDLRGRGKSACDPNPQNYNPVVYTEDIKQLLDRLQLDKVILVGTSLGGLVSMFVSAMNPGRVSGLVINDIGPELSPSGLERVKAYVCSRPAPVDNWEQATERTKMALAREYPDFGESDWQAMARRLYKEKDGKVCLDFDPEIAVPFEMEAHNSATPDIWPVFDLLASTPMMVIRGQLSDILLPETTEKMQQHHPDINLLEIADVGHTPLLEDTAICSAMEKFIAQVQKA